MARKDPKSWFELQGEAEVTLEMLIEARKAMKASLAGKDALAAMSTVIKHVRKLVRKYRRKNERYWRDK